jgi:agmatinase
MKTCHDFLGDEVRGGGAERIYIIPVPIERTTSYLQGTARAPEAVIEASRQIELYNAAVGVDLEGTGIVTVRDPIGGKDKLVSFIGRNRERLLAAFPCFIGGEHSITPWILDALELDDIGIVWLDAHADLRVQYLGDGESHACAARNSLKHGPIVSIGVRSYSREERDFLEGAGGEVGVRLYSGWCEEAADAIRSLPRRIYLSIDYDGIDPSIIPAVGTPEPGGLSWNDVIEILTLLFDEKRVVAMDAVELCPGEQSAVSDFIAAKIIYEAISRHLKVEA